MTALEQITSTLSAQKKELKKNYKVKELEIFGSYARENQTAASDIDILVTFEKVPGLLKFLELENYLSRLLGVRVDLVRREAIREELRETILNSAVPL